MAVQTVTPFRMPVAHAGQISDTTRRVVDGATAGLADISIGVPVIFVDGNNDTKTVREMAAGDLADLSGKQLGISVHSHFQAIKGYYEQGDAVNVMRVGRIWAVTGLASAPSVGAVVHVVVGGDPAKPSVNTTGGTAVPGWQFTGAFAALADGTKIAEVELTIPQIAAATGGA